MKRVVILGGGSAGWLTAGLLAAALGPTRGGRLEVTLLESPSQPPIGVGEGTWPTMRDTLHAIGLSETMLIRECDASFKQGSRFDGWVDGQPGDRYFHPFTLPQGYTEAPLAEAWARRHAALPFAELVSFQPALCLHGRAPKQLGTPEYAAVANYGYHFDAGKFALALRRHCTERLGVQHVLDDMVAVRSHVQGPSVGDIAALETRGHGALEADLFIDCSGLPARLIGEHFGVPFVSQRDVLFCDRALALQVPYASDDTPIASQTISSAQAAGWVWDIGLPTRRGVGLVYSSAHTSDEAAADTLLAHVERTGGSAAGMTPRQLRFDPGHRARFWERNCVAIGLSAGFIEPLEASALALVEYAAGYLRDQWPATRDSMAIVARRFNEGCSYRWARIVEFLKLHYVLSQRTDSDFWRDHRRTESIPERLQELLQLWRHLPPSRHDLVRHDEPFPSASYQYILYGMRFEPESMSTTPLDAAALDHAGDHFRDAAQLARKMLPALPSNRELIAHAHRHGLARM